jgi:hypothetical protein
VQYPSFLRIAALVSRVITSPELTKVISEYDSIETSIFCPSLSKSELRRSVSEAIVACWYDVLSPFQSVLCFSVTNTLDFALANGK